MRSAHGREGGHGCTSAGGAAAPRSRADGTHTRWIGASRASGVDGREARDYRRGA
ncbi:hypothetical protein WMF18_08450 [Sorangium sp. So ce315]|uniref:hypothetical protein n=1 Tax=Sorangium sp. So ce315 TaxID=3133299 RepID=UPI003F5D5F8C